LQVKVSDGIASDTRSFVIKIGDVPEASNVLITKVSTDDSVWIAPDTVWTKDTIVDVTWTHDGISVVDRETLVEGVNVIIKEFKDPTKNVYGRDTVIIIVNTKIPVVDILLPPERVEPGPNTIVENPVDSIRVTDPENPGDSITQAVYYINDAEKVINVRVIVVGVDLKLDTILVKINPNLADGSNTVEYTYTDAFGNIGTGTVTVILDRIAPVVVILKPADSSKTMQYVVPVEWTVDGHPMDTLTQQSLVVGWNAIIRTYRDRAGNEGSDTVYIELKDPKKNILIVVEQPLVIMNTKKVDDFYAVNPPKDDEFFALSFMNTLTGKEEELQYGKGSKAYESDGSQPYPGVVGEHLGPTVRVEVKMPQMGGEDAAGKLRGGDFQSIIEADGRIALTAGTGEDRELVSVSDYLQNHCLPGAYQGVSMNDLNTASLYKSNVLIELSIFDAIGQFVDNMKVQQNVSGYKYLNDAGMLTGYVELKPRQEGGLLSQTGREYGTGAYIVRAMVRSVSTLQCDLPSGRMGDRIVYSSEVSEKFGFRRDK